MSDTIDVTDLTPEQVAAVQTTVDQARTMNQAQAAEAAAAAAPAPEPTPADAPVADASPAPAPAEPATLPETAQPADGPIRDFLSRLNLQATENAISTVKNWLSEHGVTV